MGKQGVISWVPLALACAEGPACSQGRGGWGQQVPKVTPCPLPAHQSCSPSGIPHPPPPQLQSHSELQPPSRAGAVGLFA